MNMVEIRPQSTRIVVFLTTAAVVLALHAAGAVDVKINFAKEFDFKGVRTWAWNPQGLGEVKMARTQEDDPEFMRKRAEPVIAEAVAAEMGRRGLHQATAAPDVVAKYYLLLSTTTSAQELGQFLPATTQWGVPPFAPATQSLEIMNQGSLVLDLSAKDKVVWRGVAQSKIQTDADDKRRTALIREAVRDLLKRFPPK
jgi:uncharacterized protein DUF4136